jgi:hypothetical protein
VSCRPYRLYHAAWLVCFAPRVKVVALPPVAVPVGEQVPARSALRARAKVMPPGRERGRVRAKVPVPRLLVRVQVMRQGSVRVLRQRVTEQAMPPQGLPLR